MCLCVYVCGMMSESTIETTEGNYVAVDNMGRAKPSPGASLAHQWTGEINVLGTITGLHQSSSPHSLLCHRAHLLFTVRNVKKKRPLVSKDSD